MPENSALVTRQTRYGNPFTVEEFGREEALRLFKIYLDWAIKWKLLDLDPLAGKDLMFKVKLVEVNPEAKYNTEEESCGDDCDCDGDCDCGDDCECDDDKDKKSGGCNCGCGH